MKHYIYWETMSTDDFSKMFSKYFQVRVFNREIERWILGYFPVVEFVLGVSIIDSRYLHPLIVKSLSQFMPIEFWAIIFLVTSVLSYIFRKWYVAYVLLITLPMTLFGIQIIEGFLTSDERSIPLSGLFALLIAGGSLIFATKIYPNGKE